MTQYCWPRSIAAVHRSMVVAEGLSPYALGLGGQAKRRYLDKLKLIAGVDPF